MSNFSADVEVFSSSVCQRCRRANRMVAELLEEEPFRAIIWREIDVVEEIDYAVTLGVLATPAIAIGGELVFTHLPTMSQLRNAITTYIDQEINDS